MPTSGPLTDLKVLEFSALGPAPFACTLLSDMGADVVRIERAGAPDPIPTRYDARGRSSLHLDLKDADAIALCRRLAAEADILIEGNRPGVMERLGLGPERLRKANPKLVYGRMTGWGQDGPLAARAGHDINYLALSGALHAIGTPEKPIAPLNLCADYGGGAMFLVAGVLAATICARRTGRGQVVDAAMVDGAAMMMAMFYGSHSRGAWQDARGANLVDGFAPFYDTYECADGQWLCVGALEPQFFARLVDKIGADPAFVARQNDQAAWPEMRAAFTAIFRRKSRDAWCSCLEQHDVCVAPVLSLCEAPFHAHNVARDVFETEAGTVQPRPAPRFSQTPSRVQWPPRPIDQDSAAILERWQVPPAETDRLIAAGTIASR